MHFSENTKKQTKSVFSQRGYPLLFDSFFTFSKQPFCQAKVSLSWISNLYVRLQWLSFKTIQHNPRVSCSVLLWCWGCRCDKIAEVSLSQCEAAFCFRFRTRSIFQLCSVYIKCPPVCSVYRIYIRLIYRRIDFVKGVCSSLPSERFKK